MAKAKLAGKQHKLARASSMPRAGDVALALDWRQAADLQDAPARLEATAAALDVAAMERRGCPRCGTTVPAPAGLAMLAGELRAAAAGLREVAGRLGQGGATLWFAGR